LNTINYILATSFLVSSLFSQGVISDVELHSNGKINKVKYYKESSKGIELIKEKFYYFDGAIKREINYKDNEMHGKYISFYPNGQRQTEKLFQLGAEKTSRFFNLMMGLVRLVQSNCHAPIHKEKNTM